MAIPKQHPRSLFPSCEPSRDSTLPSLARLDPFMFFYMLHREQPIPARTAWGPAQSGLLYWILLADCGSVWH